MISKELSDDNDYVNMPFQDEHRLVTTMKMAEVILNEHVQLDEKLSLIASKFNSTHAEHCPNISTLLVELARAKYELTRIHSFLSVGAFDGISCTLEGC
jgi:hypothetical protein